MPRTTRPPDHPPVPPFRLGKSRVDPVEVLAHRVRVAGVVNAACVVPLLFTHLRGRGSLRNPIAGSCKSLIVWASIRRIARSYALKPILHLGALPVYTSS